MEQFFPTLNEAVNYKAKTEQYIGRYSNSEEEILLKIIIVHMSPSAFGQLWKYQREIFEEPDYSKSITKEEFESQMKAFDNADMTKKDGYFYEVLGVFHLPTGEPRFQPMSYLISNGFS